MVRVILSERQRAKNLFTRPGHSCDDESSLNAQMSNTIERVPRTEQEAADSYTRLSKWYDRFGGSEEPHIAEGLRLLNVQPGERVLEVGFGTGRSLIVLARAVGAAGRVVGIDLSPGMIAVAREQLRRALSCPSALVGHPSSPTANRTERDTGSPPRFAARGNDATAPSCPNALVGHPAGPTANRTERDTGFPPRFAARGNDTVILNRGSALHLPYAAASFDAVFSSFTLDLIDTPDIPQVLSEMRRVLKPGGRVGLVSMSKACAGNVAVGGVVKVYERFHRWLPKLIDCRPIYLQSAVESAGLQCEVHETRAMWGIPVEIVVAKG
jgi:ubiquinone/menaquinone biosynthesis C-methylase UbiE